MQGTLENAILAGADMMKGDGMHEALLQQNWEKTQYRAADWLSDWAAQKGRRDAEDWKRSQKKEGILGLAWLGLSRAGSMLSSAWDGVSELFNATVRNTKTQSNEALTHNTNDYEVIMTDAGYARKYADGRYEYIDEVTARAEMYKQTYGGEVVETKANGNKGLNPDKMRDMRELQDDGSYKVTIMPDGSKKVTVYNKDGSVKQEYYETKHVTNYSNVGSYEDAMKIAGKDMTLSNEELAKISNNAAFNEYKESKDLLYYGAKLDVAREFMSAIAKSGDDWQTVNGFQKVVNNLMDQYGDMKFYDQEHLAYTYSAIMENLGNLYGGKIGYGNKMDLFSQYPGDGYMNRTNQVDCTNLQSIGLNILGLADYKGQNVALYNPDVYDYDPARENAPEKTWDNGVTGKPGTTNLRYNTDLFDVILPSGIADNPYIDLTGTIGIMQKPRSEGGYFDHVYTSIRPDSRYIIDSNGLSGLTRPWQLNDKYKNRTVSYMKIKLPEYRRINR